MLRSRTYIATPPGATIKEQLIDRGMNQKEFAVRMGMSEKHISKLINGEVQLTPETAVRLETVLGIPDSFWNNLESIYRSKLIKVENENAMDSDLEIAKKFPYVEMSKFGWVPETKIISQKVLFLRKFFGVVKLSLLSNNQITKIACRRLAITEKSELALIAWAQQARIMAREIDTSPINIKGLLSIIPKIRKMTTLEPESFCNRLKQYLADNGIALVFLPHLKGSFLQGASFIDGNKIVVGLTTRGKDADKFWFSLFHELAHIVLGHIGQLVETSDENERSADKWSRDTLLPEDSFREFILEKDFSVKNIISYAKSQNMAPGIVVGRLQREGFIKYNTLNNLKEKYEIGL